MIAATEDPLIAKMRIRRVLPVHESCARLRELYPQCPRVYGVALLADVTPHRWWPISSKYTADRLGAMFNNAADETDPHAACRQLAASFVHEIIGRMLPLVLLEGRAWDVGPENLWMHVDKDDVLDWVAIADPTLRVLPDDPCASERRGHAIAQASHHEAVIVLPNEMALATWVAHRCHRSLVRLFATLYEVSDGALSVTAMWHIVGSAIVGVTAHMPGSTPTGNLSPRRSQAILDALAGFGLPVRRPCWTAAPKLMNAGRNWTVGHLPRDAADPVLQQSAGLPHRSTDS